MMDESLKLSLKKFIEQFHIVIIFSNIHNILINITIKQFYQTFIHQSIK